MSNTEKDFGTCRQNDQVQPDRVVDLHCLVLIIVQKIWTVWMDIIVHILNVMVQKNNRMPLFQLVDELVL